MTDLEAILDDLPKLLDGARWAYGAAWSKAGRGLDAERGMDLSRSEAERLQGDTYDIETGNHAARKAYQGAVNAVRRCDVLLATLVRGRQPAFVPLTPFSSPEVLARVIVCIEARAGLVSDPNHSRVRQARQLVDRAVRGLSKALDAGPALGIAHAEKCSNGKCGAVRAEHETVDGKVTARRGGECEACSRYRLRHDGEARPPHLFKSGDEIGQAKAAQAKRIARSEGWGAA